MNKIMKYYVIFFLVLAWAKSLLIKDLNNTNILCKDTNYFVSPSQISTFVFGNG